MDCALPCVPRTINATIMCQENELNVLWDVSHGATGYSATAVGGQGDVTIADVSDNKCLLSPLQCGEVYSLTVLAMHDECKSAPSAEIEVKSAPCSPMHITATPDCGINGASVLWEPSAGAVSYTAVFHGPDGSEVSCVSSTTSCSVSDLQCGQLYNVTVTAYDGSCHSITTNATTVGTAPCLPTNIEISMNCSSPDLLSITWSPSKGAESYIVVTEGNNGHTLSCNTTTTMCAIEGVRCGYMYAVSVTTWNTYCSSDAANYATFETAPCTPDVVEVTIDCVSYEALVYWDENNYHPTYHTAVATDPSGNELSCSGFSTSCRISGLECGLEYSFYVYSSNRKCQSINSAVQKSMTAPCQPQGLNVDLDCSSQIASMFWEESDGAQVYTVMIRNINGAVSSYTTTSTSFSSHVLDCGQNYGFSVVAIGRTCNSSKSLTIYEKSAPCAPLLVTYTTPCPTSMASIEWSASEGAIMYNVTAAEAGGSETYCNSTNTNCWVTDLNCGVFYEVKVEAVGQRCRSNASSSIVLLTAPCLPENAAVHINCENNSAMLSWEESKGALNYDAIVKHDEDLVYICDTENTSCIIADLACGASYSFSVLAKFLECNSSYTTPIGFGAVPCPPSEVDTLIYHGSVKPQEVEITWNGSNCGSDYMATIQGQIGTDLESAFVLNSYWTSYMDFYIPVPCSSIYNVTVTARNQAGPSYPSIPITGRTAPCSPKVKPLEVMEGKILISWEEAPYADEYRVMAMDSGSIICTTPGLSCQVPFTTSAFQIIAVNQAGESTPAYLSGYNGVIN
ncbi:fibronectin type III domain-containing protein 7-like isoform X2 [Bufo gargarizans]|uniref:fibronectin type III domain-containing protein 7-like isoform X2 n=1 Tax=Bufo gargarizans TaxID=30331 RepID=UPI001CF13A2A|nr:fibronectin type III domain-containing protein 7-like isoform X2 [Bufo gargarizans]